MTDIDKAAMELVEKLLPCEYGEDQCAHHHQLPDRYTHASHCPAYHRPAIAAEFVKLITGMLAAAEAGERKIADRDAKIAEQDRMIMLAAESEAYICQSLGRALGYPWYKDDQANFPGTTEADGVCVGEHVGASIADEAAGKIVALSSQLAEARVDVASLRAELKETKELREALLDRELFITASAGGGRWWLTIEAPRDNVYRVQDAIVRVRTTSRAALAQETDNGI